MNRQEALEAALKAVNGRRAYGPPESNFDRIARRWSVHILNRYNVILNLTADDVALMCIDLKLSRIEETPDHPDSWVDAAGYAACGAEITSGAVAEWWKEPGDSPDAPFPEAGL